jgi:hypothetical protein
MDFALEDSQLSGVMLHFRLAPGERAKLFRRYVRGNLFPGIPATPRDLSWRVEWKETSIVSSGEWSTCRFGDVGNGVLYHLLLRLTSGERFWGRNVCLHAKLMRRRRIG